MKIYLAGKIAANDWRHDIVPGLRSAYSDSEFFELDNDWTPMPMYRSDFQYIGPYFISCDHACAHGDNNHGAGVMDSGCIDLPFRPHSQLMAMRDIVAARCRGAILNCDVFFAWLENPCTAYGTLVELGMAYALGKTVVVGVAESSADPFADHDNEDQWFALEHASYLAIQPTAELAFKEWANAMHPIDEQRAKCESPLEFLFWDAYQLINRLSRHHLQSANPEYSEELLKDTSLSDARWQAINLAGLVAQHPVHVDGQNYRLDFALPDKKIAFEMDGYTYHGKEREHFNRDRRRDTELKLAGWEVHRFDGDLIREDPSHVVKLAAKLAEAR